MSNQLLVIHNKLETLIDDKLSAMPNDFNKSRFMQNSIAVLSDTKNIHTCDPNDIARSLLQGAFLGLDFFNKECYVIIYGGKAQFQTDYKGEIKLARKYSKRAIKDIYAKVVRDGDFFEESITNGQQSINFKPTPFNDNEIIGAFAVVLYEDGGMSYDTMTTSEIESTRRNYSKMADSKAWLKSMGEMYRKTVLRRLLKYIDLYFETSEQKVAFDASSDMDVNKSVEIEKSKEAEIIDAAFVVIPNETDEG